MEKKVIMEEEPDFQANFLETSEEPGEAEVSRDRAIFRKWSRNIVVLDVGGTIYKTTLETLTRFKGNMLSDLFADGFADLRQSDGSVFIDRSGKNFEIVLQFLRSPEDFPKLS